MRNVLACILFSLELLASAMCQAQTERRYYNDTGVVVEDRGGAESYVIFDKVDAGYKAKQYALKGRSVMMEGVYASIPSTLYEERNGAFVYYSKNGRKSREGVYKNNLRTGTWKTYAYLNGNVKSEANYLLDSLDGQFITYDIHTGEKKGEGMYKNGALVSLWKSYVNGKLASEDSYSDHKLVAKTIYYESGSVKRKIEFDEKEKVSKGVAYDSSGKEIVYEIEATDTTSFSYVEQMPMPLYNLNQYLAHNIRYPNKAREANVQGRVVIRFVVDEEGNIVNPKVKQGVSPEIDMEALKVVARMPKWKPGTQNGDPVKVYYNLPIAFTLE